MLGLREKELSILLTDDSTIAELNQRYLQRPRPTNVIAFPMQVGPFREINPDLLGDVAVSVETAHREAQQALIPLSKVLERLLTHGILHLIGYEDERSDEQRRRMEETEARIMRALSVEGMPRDSRQEDAEGGVGIS
jgi:probable rRNA maturation factor